MSMKQEILDYIDSAIEEADDQIQHAFKSENILEDWADIQINTSTQRQIDLVKFRAAFAQGITLKGKQAESYAKIMCEAVETITSYQD